jgi:ABC-type multidrug transport system fused ATPase/permease subunit
MSIWEIIRRLAPFVRPYRAFVIVSLILTMIGALAAQVNPLVLRYTVDTVERLLRTGAHASESLSLLLFISAILFGKEVVNIAVKYGQSMVGENLRVNLSSALSQYAIERILSYRYAFFATDENATGKLQTRIDRGAESLTSFVQNIFIDLLPLFANAILALVLMFNANFYVGLVASVIMPIYFILSWRQAGMLKGVRRGLRALREQKTNGLFNIIESIIVIKSFVREEYERDKQFRLQQDLINAQLKQRKTNYAFDALKTFVEQVGVVLIIILTAYLVLDQQMTIGAIMFHILLFNNVSAPIRQLHRIYDQMNEAMTYAEGFFEILDADKAIEESGPLTTEHLRGEFELKDVSFTYPNGTQALWNVNMTIPAGKTVAFVGLSGAGKSTLLNLLCKFYAPTSGEICLDGKDILDYETHLLRRKIGLVLQKNHIFRGSIEENIRYGYMRATTEEVVAAAKKAYLHDQIEKLPHGYASEAQSLSGGQQQRIAIARLFLKDPPVIFLDEPTASLDAVATEQIKSSLDAIKENRTTVIISHSISQIIDSDVIYVLKEGRVVEIGTHHDLYEKRGTYFDIFNASARSLNLDKIARTLDGDGNSAENSTAAKSKLLSTYEKFCSCHLWRNRFIWPEKF